MDKMIVVENLCKRYGAVKAVQGTDFYVEKGQLFALLGENGAGKSTTIDILATLLPKDAGEVRIGGYVLGKDDAAIRGCIGVVFQQSLLDGKLSVRENLLVRGSFYGLSARQLRGRVDELCAALHLREFIDRRYEKLSGGQRRRADIARALVNTPEVLFLDEPTAGLDPSSRKAIWETVRALQQQSGTTVLLTTHYMEEAAAADYVIMMGHGRILAKGTPPSLREEYSSDALWFEAKDAGAARALLAEKAVPFHENGAVFVINLSSTMEALPLLGTYQKLFKNFEVRKGSLEDAFLAIAKSDVEGGGA